MPNEGLASQDLRARAAVQTLRRSGNGHQEVDPIDLALSTSRKITANQILQKVATDSRAEAIKSENEQLKAEIEQTKLKAEQQTKPQNDQWQAYILGQMEKLQSALGDTQKALTEQQMGALQERLSLLATELERTRTERPEPANPVVTAKQSIQEARDLLELLAPAQTPPPPTVGGDAHLQAWTLRATLDQKRWDADREDKHAETMARLELERELKRAELDLKANHYQRMDRFFNDTAPKLIEVGQRLLDSFMGQRATVPTAPATAAQTQPPAGYEAGTCVQCQRAVFYKPEWGEVVCQNCGASYTLTPDETASGAVEQPSADRYHAHTIEGRPVRQAVENPDEGSSIG